MQLNFLKPLPFSDDYYVNDLGEVFSNKKGNMKQMKVRESTSGYFTISLHCKNIDGRKKNDRNVHSYQVHRLIAETWIPNPKKLPVVNHKDGDKKNNAMTNLEWVSHSQNVRHSLDVLKNRGHIKSVIQVTLEGKFVCKYPSLVDAEKATKIDSRSICLVCQGKRRKAGEYVWFYEKDYVQGRGMRKLAQCKKVRQFMRDGTFVKEYESVQDAAKAVGALHSNISNACLNRLQTSKGYIWRYIEKEEILNETEDWITLEKYPRDKISPDGRVFSTWGKKFKTPQDRKGYKFVSVTDAAGRETKISVHRLVALAYIPNPLSHPVVNHKDGNPSNNTIENLEWCTYAQNAQHAHDTGLCSSKKKVLQLTKEGKELKTFNSMKEAANHVGLSSDSISHACRGVNKTAGGYTWRYA